ncbi:hypothetical protein BDV95DRAFT_352617 [Massariosphaeria phaeospora]|uniref:S1 motif domain-containing protein n=1 Tax=Massariosphaeria phaeospora TaxID=100035 RepID=A0A7C8IIH2_9PLEO|nr:hypothetical protein BDV95DRAFT_352617 [Massariosphaeria phaeospora]
MYSIGFTPRISHDNHPAIAMALPSIALPGQLLGPATKYAPGPGTHMHDQQVYASIAGPVVSSPPSSVSEKPSTSTSTPTPKPSSKPGSKPTPTSLPLLSIPRPSPTSSSPSSTSTSTLLPTLSSPILARITRLGPRFATCAILVIDSTVCRETFQGLIRREDVRATEKDKVRIEDSFRVGDLVRGVVISLGDQSNYYISTAQNEYGVVMARSEDGGGAMFPVSWREFCDPRTGVREGRKVAKPF